MSNDYNEEIYDNDIIVQNCSTVPNKRKQL